MATPSPRYPSVHEISHARVDEEAECPGIVVGKEELAYRRGAEETGDSEEVGESVDVFVENREGGPMVMLGVELD